MKNKQEKKKCDKKGKNRYLNYDFEFEDKGKCVVENFRLFRFGPNRLDFGDDFTREFLH